MDIFTILISLGGFSIIVGVFYTFFWSQEKKPNKKSKTEIYKSVNNTSIPTIYGKSYNINNPKKDNVNDENKKVEKPKENLVFVYDDEENHQSKENQKKISSLIDEKNESETLPIDNDEEFNFIDPEEELDKYSIIENIDIEEAFKEVFENDEIENVKEDVFDKSITNEDVMEEEINQEDVELNNDEDVFDNDIDFNEIE
jgi:hypothetical protein